ncbi:MAG TPA: hypothetical protein VE914_14930 [Candidatus Angelobacter sp.]|nr:hypothetical protein [Candidatus Angelobacter sp.]
MSYEYEATAAPAVRPVETRQKMNTWTRPVARMAFAAGCAIFALQATSARAAAMTDEACQELSADQLLLAVDQGVCTLDVLPSAGPAPQIADSGTTGEHDGGSSGGGANPGGGSGSGGSGGGSSGGGSSGGDDGNGGGDDGGDDGGDSGGGDGGSGGGDGHGHDHNHGHGHGHGGHGHGGHGHGGCGE